MSNLSLFKGARVLLTGHTGFKGSWMSLWLTHLGAEVHGISIGVPTGPSHFVEADIQNKVTHKLLDIRDRETLTQLIERIQPDFVFHFAAQALVRRSYLDPVDTWSTNAVGTINVLEALRSIKHFCVAILVTSDKCYQNVEWVWGYRETDKLGGPDPYSASKGAAELAISSYVSSFFPSNGPVRIGVGRAGNVIGGGDWAGDRIVPDCMHAWSQNRSVSLRSPLATRPWQHVLEPLSGYLNLALVLHKNGDLHGEPFNFGPPAHQNHSVSELVTQMTKHWDQVVWEDVSNTSDEPYESGLLKLNCDKAMHHLGWKATWDFETTVRETVLWYKGYYEKAHSSVAKFSTAQIKSYVKSAKELGINWAQ